MMKKLCCTLFFASWLFTQQVHAHGSDLYPVSLEQRIQNSALVAEGTVISQHSFWNEEHTLIYTSNIVKLHRVLKGSTTALQVEIITEGGTVDDKIHMYSATLSLSEGQTGIFFCEPQHNYKSGKGMSASYMVYSSLQGFIEYNTTDRTAGEPFHAYATVNNAINKIITHTGTDIQLSENPALQERPVRKTTATPTITNFTPTTITAGTASVLTINGTNFGSTQGTGYVEFLNGNDGGATWVKPLATDYVSWSNTQIQVKVPNRSQGGAGTAGTGAIRVTNSDPATVTSGSSLTISYSYTNVEISSTAVAPYLISKNGNGGYNIEINSTFASNTSALGAFTRALNNWTCATNMNWPISSTSSSTSSAASDGVNIVAFSSGLPAGVLGRTTSYYSGYSCNSVLTGTLEGFDLIFDDVPSVPWEYGTSAASGSEIDFESVVVHELGHAHQLGHIISSGAIMHFSISAGQTSRVLASSTDIAGGTYIATRSRTSNPCGFTTIAYSGCPYYFRTKASGDWNATGTWQTSYDNSYWIDATLTPSGTNAGSISVLNAHTVTVTADVTVDELTINNGGIVNVNPGIALSINDGTGTDVTVATTGTLALKSTVAGSARIGASAGTTSGSIIIEKYIPGKRAFRFMSHPFSSGIALSQLTDDIDITGSGGTTNGFTATQTNSPSAYWWNATAADNTTAGNNPGWTTFTNTNGASTNSWDRDEMLRILIRGSKGQGLTGATYTPSATTLDISGSINIGTQTVTLTKGTNSNFVACGNPLPSGVQMQNVSRGSNVGANYYVWDATSGATGAYVTNPWSISYVLPMGGAFFTTVSANSNNTVAFEEADKTSGGASVFKGTATSNWVELMISDSTTKWDRLLINFDSNAMTVQDTLDGVKLYNPGLDFFTISEDSNRLAVDIRPYTDSTSIPLGLTAYTRYNRYVISTGMFEIPAHVKLYLHDKYLNKVEEMKQGYEYWFDVTADTNTQGNNRFEINMKGKPTISIEKVEQPAKMQLVPNPAREEVKLSYDNVNGNALVRLTTITGQVVFSRQISNNSGSIIIPLQHLPAGMYVAELQSTNARFTAKLVKE